MQEIEGAPGVFTFPMFTLKTCDLILQELDCYNASGLPSPRPNSMNKYGLILNSIGLEDSFARLQQDVLNQISRLLFPEIGLQLDAHHTFLVQYTPGEDLGLDMHTDDSDVTFNICLGREFTGAKLNLCGRFGTTQHRQHMNSYSHIKGGCVVHLGKQRHGAANIESGERVNLIIWNQMDVLRDGTTIDELYMKLCKECIDNNDIRFRIKNKINLISNSELKEQKSYKINRLLIELNCNVEHLHLFIKPIQYFSYIYDEIIIQSSNDISLIYDTFYYDNTINFLKKRGFCVYLPILAGEKLKFAKIGKYFKKNRFGINEPINTPLMGAHQMDLILMPLVGFDKYKNRLGMGGGFYDKTLSFQKNRLNYRVPKLFGLAFDCQEVEQLDKMPWDIPVDGIITPTRFFK